MALLPPNPDYDGSAIDFTDRPVGQGLSQFLSLPASCRLQPVDHDLLHRRVVNPDRQIAIFGSIEQALAKGLGYCLMREDVVLCETFAGPPANGVSNSG